MAGTTMDMNDIAALMASQGIKTDDDLPQDQIPEAKISAENEPEKPSETPASQPETGPASQTTPESTPDAPPAQQQPAGAPADWREELKKADTNEVLKLLGFDDKTIGFFNKWKGGGDINEYLRAASVDYAKMPAEEVMRHQLRAEYPELSDEDFQLLYQNRVIEKYQLDPDLFTEQQRKLGTILLNTDAKVARAKFIADQQQLVLDSKPPSPSGPTPAEQAQQAQQTRSWYRNEVIKHPLAASILANKKLTIGEGDDAFHFDIADPNGIFDTVSDQQKMMSKIFDARQENGQTLHFPNGEKNTLIGLVAEYGMSLFDAYGKHMKARGAAEALEPIDNASRPGSTLTRSGEPEPDPAAALAKNGAFSR